ncbi:MAG: hypothetical protein RJA20_2913 [Bacteroidota bacterium]|jgi:predicted O-methyltransferase YrrM
MYFNHKTTTQTVVVKLFGLQMSGFYSAAWFRVRQWISFYRRAVTRYQIHSPFVFQLTEAILEDRRYFYAYGEIEWIRREMTGSNLEVDVTDFGTGQNRRRRISEITRNAASAPSQGRLLFRLADWLAPKTILELGTSAGIGTMYLRAGNLLASMVSLEGCPQTQRVAKNNLDKLALNKRTKLVDGPFEKTLIPALEELVSPDLVYIDGNHRKKPVLQYFETCLSYANNNTVFIFDDIHWSPEMEDAWSCIKNHNRVTLTVDLYDISLAFINPDFLHKQHFSIVPARWKFWRLM